MGRPRRGTSFTGRMDRRGRTAISGSSIRACGPSSNASGLRAAFPPAYVRVALRRVLADVFNIIRLMGHSTVTLSQGYVNPSPEAVELAYESMTAIKLRGFPHKFPYTGSRR